LTFDEVTTFFHEFGHAIHGLLSNVTYRSLSGTSVPRDFVELPSQILECWAAETEVLNVYAKHYQTGEIIPKALIDKMNRSNKFGQGFASAEYLAASLLDMEYHSQNGDITEDASSFENKLAAKIGLMDAIIHRYRSTYFSHIFSGGYSAGYYSYIWSELLDADAFAYFKQNGIFDPTTAKSFYDNILTRGGTEDPAELYRKFRGQDPSVQPLLERRGLK
jgi:peptidyl-dipeptidase Dcp